jgi:hypothetical protein
MGSFKTSQLVPASRLSYSGFGATILRARMAVEPLAVVSDYPGLVGALRRRVVELGTTITAVDQLSGLPDGYVGKLLAPRMPKHMGDNLAPRPARLPRLEARAGSRRGGAGEGPRTPATASVACR